MKYLSLDFPGGYSINPPAGFKGEFTNIGSLVELFLKLIVYISVFLLVYWLSWGIYEYIFAGGNKEKLAAARRRITLAIVGFLVVLMAYSVGEWVKGIFTPGGVRLNQTVIPVSPPN